MADGVIFCSVYFKNQRNVDNSGMNDFEVPFDVELYQSIIPYLNIPLGSQKVIPIKGMSQDVNFKAVVDGPLSINRKY